MLPVRDELLSCASVVFLAKNVFIMCVCVCVYALYTWITLFFFSMIFANHMLQMMLDGFPILFFHWLTGYVHLALFLYLEGNS